MNDPMDENNLLNDRDMIKDGQGKSNVPIQVKRLLLLFFLVFVFI